MISVLAQAVLTEQTPGSNVTVMECTVALPAATISAAGGSMTAGQGVQQNSTLENKTIDAGTSNASVGPGYDITVVFANDSALKAKEVDFAFGPFGRRTSDIVESGTFSPHVTIKRRATIHPDFAVAASLEKGVCTVTRVIYADGSQWTLVPPGRP